MPLHLQPCVDERSQEGLKQCGYASLLDLWFNQFSEIVGLGYCHQLDLSLGRTLTTLKVSIIAVVCRYRGRV